MWADEDSAENLQSTGDLHANFRLSNGGEAIGLFAPDGLSPQHTVVFGPQTDNVSEGLFPDGAVGSRHFMGDWTPRAANRIGEPAPPAITEFDVAGGVLHLRIDALPHRSYRLEFKDDLNAPSWTPAGTVQTASDGLLIFMENVGGLPQRFFRVRLE